MTELSGTLEGLGLSALIRFLSGLHKTGSLELVQDDWSGEIFFETGKLTHATFGTRTGLRALDAMIEVLPRASFSFDAFDAQAVATGAPTIELDHDGLLQHLGEVVGRVSSGQHSLPAADAVPVQTTSDGETDEPVQLDRAALQTLLAVDGQRAVREILARRGSFDALWHLAKLHEVGLIKLGPARDAKDTRREPENAAASARVEIPRAAVPAAPVALTPAVDSAPAREEPVGAPVAAAHCPKLGFEDDPASSFGRPTRLHRCFAAVRPLPLSLDQQRELCLSDQYGTCPRLIRASPSAPSRPARPTPPAEAEPADEPRVVRLPLTARPTTEWDAASSAAPIEPRPLRQVAPLSPVGDRPRPTVAVPTPLRARLNRAPTAEAATAHEPQSAPAGVIESVPSIRPRRRLAAAEPSIADDVPIRDGRFGRLLLLAISVVALALLAVAAIVYLLPQWDTFFGDNAIDPTALPNAQLVQSGTPVADLGLSRLTPVPARATPSGVQDVQPTSEASSLAARPTPRALAQPTPALLAQPTPASSAQPTPGAEHTDTALFHEAFSANDAGWPSNPAGAALLTNGTYRISPRQAGQFAAVSAPISNVPSDAVISATFRKLAGPVGGGYGIIVRDQEQSVHDGTSQNGHYYVLEAGDKGEVGIWRRDGDHWVDLLPWQHSDAVKTGSATNELVVRAVGNTLSLSVNGTPVATRNDATFAGGRAGLFVGGDGNQVAVSHFAIQSP